MALIPEDKIAEVRDRTDIVQVIGEHVALKKSGINHKGLCPFHAEKTPSFNVNAEKRFFKCFGCGKSGDVITFVMEVEGRSFLETVRELARKAGVDLPDERVVQSPAAREAARRAEAEKSKLARLNELATDFFRAELVGPRGARARSYVEGRGIAPDVLDAFKIGHAPAGWDSLVRLLDAKRVPHELGERAGLIRRRDNVRLLPDAPPTKATHFDLFRDRVMFPVLDPQGEIIGFSGRILDAAQAESAPKYLNTPETALYKKGEVLYGLHAAKAGIRHAGRAILVEGNFDVLAMHAAGFAETVAPMGTALTPSQAHLLHRFTGKGTVFMFLDGDGAGRRAAAKNVSLFLDEEMMAKIAVLPAGEDPDSFVRKNGRDGAEQLFVHAVEGVEYFCDRGADGTGLSIIERIKLFEEEAAPLVRKVSLEAARMKYAERLAHRLQLPLDVVQRSLRTGRKVEAPPQQLKPSTENAAAAAGAATPAPPVKLSPLDFDLVALVADHPRLLTRLAPSGVLKHLANASLREALEAIAAGGDGTSAKFDAQALAARVDPQLRAQVLDAAMRGKFSDLDDPEAQLRGIVAKKERDRIDTEMKAALREMQAANGDPSRINELRERIERLKKQQEEIGGRRLGLKG